MDKCKHINTETESYPQEYYGKWSIITVVKCIDCDEIIEEKEVKMK